jgi:hypothetical protein
LKPWFVAIGTVLIATCPIGARELRSTEPAGRTDAAQLRNPAFEIVLDVRAIVCTESPLRSAGVTHGISPSQYSGTDVFGVAPEMI